MNDGVSPADSRIEGVPSPSGWVTRHVQLFKPHGRVLDVACGSGRHLRWLVAQGFDVTGVDRDHQALSALKGTGQQVLADLESGPWPFADQTFDAVVVTNYLWRPLLPAIGAALAPGGVLIYETFAHGQQTIGRPSRADFLLQPGELLRAFSGLRVVAFEDGYEAAAPRFVQRLVAVNAVAELREPVRYALLR
jgi:SAM-dependent methyltransferase